VAEVRLGHVLWRFWSATHKPTRAIGPSTVVWSALLDGGTRSSFLLRVAQTSGPHSPKATLQKHCIQCPQQMVECYGSNCRLPCTPGFCRLIIRRYYRGNLCNLTNLNDQLCGISAAALVIRSHHRSAINHFQSGIPKRQGRLCRKIEVSPVSDLSEVEYFFGPERFFRPASLGSLFECMDKMPEARLIAGATELGLDITSDSKNFPP